jgi:type II secretory pathway pseudopilin PulG
MQLTFRHRRFVQQGLGLVELMVGITIGLIVAAGASMVAVNQITEHRRLMLETQVQQDLRAAADLLQQDMRRAGFRGLAQLGVWAPASGVGTPLEQAAQAATANVYSTITKSDTDNIRSLEYSYARRVDSEYSDGTALLSNEYFGIKWDRAKQTLYLLLGKKDGQPNWQPITDPDTVKIVDFDIQVVEQSLPLSDFCDSPCTTAGCPLQKVRRVEFKIRGSAKHDANVVRTLTGTERIRADAMSGACT